MFLLDLFNDFYSIPDPEIPFIQIGELGMIHQLYFISPSKVCLEFIPSYLGCPATSMLMSAFQEKFQLNWNKEGLYELEVLKVFTPLWGLHRVSETGKKNLLKNGIGIGQVLCPNCQSKEVEMVSNFSSTPCKRLMRCLNCKIPFESMKCSWSKKE